MAVTHNIMSLDVGSRRIGVAIANMDAKMAQALITIDRKDFPEIFPKLTELFEKHSIDTVVVGLPRGLDGQETMQTASAREFALELESVSGLKVLLQDEAGTSVEAEDVLKASKRSYQKGDIDKAAAAIILRDWLAGQTTGVPS